MFFLYRENIAEEFQRFLGGDALVRHLQQYCVNACQCLHAFAYRFCVFFSNIILFILFFVFFI